MHSFSELKIPQELQKALQAMEFETLTPIQAKAIPVALEHRDLIGCAQAGAGKSAAFCIPIIARLIKLPQATAVILIPTRERVAQIAKVLEKLSLHTPQLLSALLIGGKPIAPQLKALQRRPRMIVATPDRLVEHLKKGSLSLSSTAILVLDEADRMLDLGFAPQLQEIQRFLPRTRQTLFFSATLPAETEKLSARFLKDPVRITVVPTPPAVKKTKQPVINPLHLRKSPTLIFAST